MDINYWLLKDGQDNDGVVECPADGGSVEGRRALWGWGYLLLITTPLHIYNL